LKEQNLKEKNLKKKRISKEQNLIHQPITEIQRKSERTHPHQRERMYGQGSGGRPVAFSLAS
jgi:hypothetical protein